MAVRSPVKATAVPEGVADKLEAVARAMRHDDDAPHSGGRGAALRERASASRPKPPEDRDERLATFLRGPDGDPGRTELRVSWCIYNTGAYLRLHTWERGPDGSFWPVKGSAVLVRRAELVTFADAVSGALDRSDELAARRRSTPR